MTAHHGGVELTFTNFYAEGLANVGSDGTLDM